MMRITLDRKILAGFVIISIVLIVTTIISFRNNESFVEANRWVAHTQEVLNHLEQIHVNAVEAETGMRGYVITGLEEYLEPYNDAKVILLNSFDKVRSMTRDNARQQENMEELEVLIRSQISHLETCITMRRKDFEAARELVRSGQSRKNLVAIRKELRDAREMEQRLLEERKKQSNQDSQRFNRNFIVLIVVMGTSLLTLYVIIITNLKALRKAELETANKNWSLMGSSELVKKMQGNMGPKELSQVIINYLVPYVNACAGALYVVEGEELRLMSRYAGDQNRLSSRRIQYGEGVVGQAAVDKKPIAITNIPKDYFNIHTGFGDIAPKNILAAPVVFENSVVGVIELGSLGVFSELQKQYIQLIMDSVAIALTSSEAREKTKELLDETQRQAEELEAQQEELKQYNENLHEKTDMLERSEAELKAQQEELQQANEELEEKANLLEQQKETLENAKIQIENKAGELELTSKFKSEFLANMSHELRTPLNSILILSQILSENRQERLSEKEIQFAKNIHNSGNDLLNLINEILDLAKIEAGKMELDISGFPVEDITQHLQAMFEEVAKNKSIDFNIQVANDAQSMMITSDRQRVEQILRNLLSNALKFTRKNGSVTLSIRKVEYHNFTRKPVLNAPDILAFAITDTGIGIPRDKLEMIFEAFQQADGTTKRKYGGTGLGLSISRELAYALGGEIKLESEVGKGSTFTLFLPVTYSQSVKPVNSRERTSREHLPVVKDAHAGKVEHNLVAESIAIDDRNNVTENDRLVLIIEDDLTFAQVLLDFVRERNYKGIIATQGNTGLSYARSYKPDAIMLDMSLPVMSGEDVLRHLKNDPSLRHIPVQIISGVAEKKESLELGAFDFIKKPITKETFSQALDKIEDFVSRKLKHLLIVEDNDQHSKAVEELIGGDGDVKCFSAYSGKDAYEMLQENAFDCVIVDLGLPDMTGFDLLEKIKENPKLNKVPIIVYTGKDLKRDEADRLNKLASSVILKTAYSHERLLDETILFLHRVESHLPKDKQHIIRKLHKTDEVLKDKKVLVVDDDIRNIYSLTNVLDDEGMQCLTAENGRDAINILKENPTIDIVLMDVMMPEMDGYEATAEIRKSHLFQKLPIIALTAKAMKGDREKCLAAGMSDYISKPINIEQLLSLMRVWLYT